MKESTEAIFSEYWDRHSFLQPVAADIRKAVSTLEASFQRGGKLLVCGNGGSCADADHIVGELVKSFRLHRTIDRDTLARLRAPWANKLEGSLPAINLGAQVALITAMINDVGAEYIFAQQVMGYGNPGDVLLGISTSGNSLNVLYAGEVARAKGMTTIGLTGRGGGKMAETFDILLRAQADSTEDVQDIHSTIYHIICAVLENEFWGV